MISKTLRQSCSSLWPYARPYSWILAISTCLAAIIGLLEAVTPLLIGLIFDTLLRASTTPSISIPWIQFDFDLSNVDGRLFLGLLVAVTAIKAIAEYGSVN